MKKLLTLKKWLTLDDTAKHLSLIFDEDISRADVLRLGLDGHLTISVDFVNYAKGFMGKVIPISEAKYAPSIFSDTEQLGDVPVQIMTSAQISETEVVEFDYEIITLRGVWDLAMIGCERLDVEHEFQQLTGGPEVTLQNLNGTFVYPIDNRSNIVGVQDRFKQADFDQLNDIKKTLASELKGSMASLDYSKPPKYFPAGCIPNDAVLVVRTESIKEFERDFSEGEDKPLSLKTTNTHLKIIQALSEGLIDGLTGKKNKDADAVLAVLDKKGIESPATSKTLAKYLGEASEL